MFKFQKLQIFHWAQEKRKWISEFQTCQMNNWIHRIQLWRFRGFRFLKYLKIKGNLKNWKFGKLELLHWSHEKQNEFQILAFLRYTVELTEFNCDGFMFSILEKLKFLNVCQSSAAQAVKAEILYRGILKFHRECFAPRNFLNLKYFPKRFWKFARPASYDKSLKLSGATSNCVDILNPRHAARSENKEIAIQNF